MKIKRFVAPDMRTVLRMVREEQGADAVILSNRPVPGGIEVVAATDYDEQLAQDALKSLLPQKPATALDQARDADIGLPAQLAGALRSAVRPPVVDERPALIPEALVKAIAAKSAAPAAAPAPSAGKRADFSAFLAEAKERIARSTSSEMPAPEVARPAPAPAPRAPAAAFMDPEPTVAPTAAALDAQARATHREAEAVARRSAPRAVRISPWDEDPSLLQVRAELVEMREMMEREMQRMTGERLRGSPARAFALDALASYGCEDALAREVAAKIPAEADPARARGLMLGQLAHLLPVATFDPLRTPGVVALVGPTGAGKTTTLAKLAARYAAEHGPRDVALITTDTQRPGGREQLHAYGRQFGLTVVEAGSEEALHEALHRLRDYPLVLVDTAGHGQRDRAMVGQLNWLRHAGKVRTMLVMPANAHSADLDEVIRRFGFVAPEAAILTKLDETGRLGAALSVLVRHQLPLAYTTDGQNVPDDLSTAEASRLVLKLEELRRAGDRPAEDADAA
ncbi:flagellar biosynthesis protein FlhF [Silanimonas sp.]|uniref:flagellar biosynthesis protein FlhF n=1 Tax=Silanimonas sp. TaxID=1929290 RepID=UPI0022BCEA0A|nr:flagellar biosynthesis protein FlhF [Silanimonas sp.]MCZ8062241.1 flagellar biosynthesis protein FlhF [Silanimonas sp.]